MKKLLLAFGFAGLFSFSASAQVGNYNEGDVVNDFTVTDIHGNVHNLYTYLAQGKYVMIDFFFDTCGPCQQFQPKFNEFYDKYGCNAGDVISLTINNGSDSDAEVIAYENTYGGSFKHAPAVSADGGSGAVDTDFNPAAYPTIILINPDKTLAKKDIWPVPTIATLEAAYPTGSITPMACSSISIEEGKTVSDRFELYPNPTNGNIYIEGVSSVEGEFTVEIFSLTGQKVYLGDYNSTDVNATINTSSLPSGQYIVRLFNEKGFNAQKKLTVN